MLRIGKSFDVVAKRKCERLLQAPVGACRLWMSAQIVAKQQMVLPARVGRLHDMDVVGPGTRYSLAEEQFGRQPSFIFGYISVAQCSKRLDASGLRFSEALHADQQVNNRFGRQSGH